MPTTTAPGASGQLFHDPAKLRTWRKEAGLSAAEVSVAVPIGYSWLRDLEQGRARRTPSLRMLARLTAFYGHELVEVLATTGGTR